MLKYLKQETNMTITENGAAALRSTGSECLDLFATIGALRRKNDLEIEARFVRAFTENKDIAMKLLFFARDIRGGLGERRVFRVILNWLAQHEPTTVKKNLEYIAEYGRFDDLLSLLGTPCEGAMLEVIKSQLELDIAGAANGKEVSLLAKWLPSVNASNRKTIHNAKKIARRLEMSDAEYRKTLTSLRAYISIIENNLRKRDYTFDYSKQPSKALFKYRKAFMHNDAVRYNDFLKKVSAGEAVLHADTLSPYELVEPYLDWRTNVSSFMRDVTDQERNALNATWSSLPDYGNGENALAVIDTSGSMYSYSNPMPASVALSLGIYFAEHNRGHFANHFIEFSKNPQLIEIKGETFADRLRYVASFNKIANTDIDSVFNLILDTAVKNNLPQCELPAKLIIISDMEFDICVENAAVSNFDNAKAKFEANGYALPKIVFWNVASRRSHQPVKMNEQGVALVSGCTPKLFSMIASGTMEPLTFMLEILESERYAKISA